MRPGRKNEAGETLAEPLMPLHPVPSSTTAGNRASHLRSFLKFTPATICRGLMRAIPNLGRFTFCYNTAPR